MMQIHMEWALLRLCALTSVMLLEVDEMGKRDPAKESKT